MSKIKNWSKTRDDKQKIKWKLKTNTMLGAIRILIPSKKQKKYLGNKASYLIQGWIAHKKQDYIKFPVTEEYIYNARTKKEAQNKAIKIMKHWNKKYGER